MGGRGVIAGTPEEARRLSAAELDRQIAVTRWRLGAISKSTIRSMARKRLAMLEDVKAERTAT